MRIIRNNIICLIVFISCQSLGRRRPEQMFNKVLRIHYNHLKYLLYKLIT